MIKIYVLLSTGIISVLTKSGCVVQVAFNPSVVSCVVSPWSVAAYREKKRLILDLSVLNKYIKK